MSNQNIDQPVNNGDSLEDLNPVSVLINEKNNKKLFLF